MNKKLWSLITIIALLTGLLSGCGNDTDKETSKSQTSTFTIGMTSNHPVPLTDQYYGITQDILGDSVTVNWETFTTGPEAITALVNGNLDVVFGVGSLPVVSTGVNGFEYEIVAYETLKDDLLTVATSESGITSLSDLAGHTVGTSVGTAGHYDLLNQLKEVGLTASDITIVNSDTLDAALAAGEIDAATISYYKALPLIEDGTAVLVSPYENDVVWVLVNKDFAASNPDIISKYILALHKSAIYIENNKEQVISDVGTANDLDESIITAGIEHLNSKTFFEIGDDFTYSNLQSVYEFAIDQELVEGEYDLESYINTSYVEEAKKLAEE